MPKFAANLTCLFPDLPFMDRFRAAKDAGFDAVELPDPYDHPAQEIRDALAAWAAHGARAVNVQITGLAVRREPTGGAFD